MYFANPWGLLGLLALPAILAIHFFHRRYPPLVIAGVHLWGIETEVQTMGRRWDRLPLSASLLLELLAALLLSLLLSQPRLGVLGTATHMVVVLDHSASMQAGPPNGDSFRDQALQELRKRAEELPGGSRVTLILSGPLPQTLAGPAVTWQEAEASLADWTPESSGTSVRAGLDRAAQFAGTSGRMLFLTDHLPSAEDAVPEMMEVVAVGDALRNVALTTAEWTLDPDTSSGKLYLRIANFNAAGASVEVRGTSGRQDVFTRTLSVPAGGEEPLKIEVPRRTGELRVEIFSPADGLKLDNTITLEEPRFRPVKVSVDLPAESASREAVLRGLEILPSVDIVPDEEADLKIATALPLPPSDPDLWWFGIGPLDPSEAAMSKAVDLKGPYILERRNRLVRGLMPGTLIWGGVQPVPGRVAPLLSCDRAILLGQLEATFTTGYLLNIDFARSQLQDSEDWPILLSNLVEMRRENLPGLNRWNYRLNETVKFRVPEISTPDDPRPELSLVGPAGARPLVRGMRDSVEIHSIDQAGTYEIRAGETVVDRFAVNFFDADESNLGALNTGHAEPTGSNDDLFKLDNPYSWLILLVLTLVMGMVIADWKSLRG